MNIVIFTTEIFFCTLKSLSLKDRYKTLLPNTGNTNNPHRNILLTLNGAYSSSDQSFSSSSWAFSSSISGKKKIAIKSRIVL